MKFKTLLLSSILVISSTAFGQQSDAEKDGRLFQAAQMAREHITGGYSYLWSNDDYKDVIVSDGKVEIKGQFKPAPYEFFLTQYGTLPNDVRFSLRGSLENAVDFSRPLPNNLSFDVKLSFESIGTDESVTIEAKHSGQQVTIQGYNDNGQQTVYSGAYVQQGGLLEFEVYIQDPESESDIPEELIVRTSDGTEIARFGYRDSFFDRLIEGSSLEPIVDRTAKVNLSYDEDKLLKKGLILEHSGRNDANQASGTFTIPIEEDGDYAVQIGSFRSEPWGGNDYVLVVSDETRGSLYVLPLETINDEVETLIFEDLPKGNYEFVVSCRNTRITSFSHYFKINKSE